MQVVLGCALSAGAKLNRGRNRDAIVGLPDGAQAEMTDDLACMLPACLVAAGVLVEGAWLDPEHALLADRKAIVARIHRDIAAWKPWDILESMGQR